MKQKIAKILKDADAFASKRGIGLTASRRQVFELVLQAEKPIGAYALLSALKEKREDPKPPTVYRALDFLLENGFIHRIESMNAFIACHDFGDRHDSQFLLCDDCGRSDEIHDHALAKTLEKLAQGYGFEMHHQMIELHGKCADCRV